MHFNLARTISFAEIYRLDNAHYFLLAQTYVRNAKCLRQPTRTQQSNLRGGFGELSAVDQIDALSAWKMYCKDE